MVFARGSSIFESSMRDSQFADGNPRAASYPGLLNVLLETGGYFHRNQQRILYQGEFLMRLACLGTGFSSFVESSAQR